MKPPTDFRAYFLTAPCLCEWVSLGKVREALKWPSGAMKQHGWPELSSVAHDLHAIGRLERQDFGATVRWRINK